MQLAGKLLNEDGINGMSLIKDAGLAKITFTYVKDGTLMVTIRVVQQQDVQKIEDFIMNLGE